MMAIARSANSGARLSTIAETAALLAAYRLWWRTPMRALTDDISTIRPALLIAAAAAWVTTARVQLRARQPFGVGDLAASSV